MNRKFLVTGALPYSNNRLHVGHIAGAYLPSDIFVRYLRSNGDDVRYSCGSDDNGVAIEISAMKESTTPGELSTRYHNLQRAPLKGLAFTSTSTAAPISRHSSKHTTNSVRIFSSASTTTATS
ncbi:MAG: class I tRNA ligase family protein [Planctomycetes bacterium]|nr:class I tRNA ligase family protein [Planctomycetota bacterium]